METIERLRLVGVAPYVPFDGIAHAGGHYLYRHISILLRSHEYTLVAPDNEENRAAMARKPDGLQVILVPPSAVWSKIPRVVRTIIHTLTVMTPDLRFRKNLLGEALRLREGTHVYDLHWPQYAWLLHALGNRAPAVGRVMIEHDVLSEQVLAPRPKNARTISQLYVKLRVFGAQRRERAFLPLAFRVVVFSEKDVQLLSRTAPAARCIQIYPPLAAANHLVANEGDKSDSQVVLFVGALNRDVNVEAVLRLHQRILPLIRRDHPGVQLLVAGDGADPALVRQLTAEGATFTGYVSNLNDVYALADLAIVPLTAGAGLKFKVAEAMLAGVPVVSTPIGADGYPKDLSLFWAVAETDAEIAKAASDAFSDRGKLKETSLRAREWSWKAFSEDEFERRLAALYLSASQNG